DRGEGGGAGSGSMHVFCLLNSRGPGVAEIVESLRRRPRLVPKAGVLRELQQVVEARGIQLASARENPPAGIAVARRDAIDNGGAGVRPLTGPPPLPAPGCCAVRGHPCHSPPAPGAPPQIPTT